MEQDELLGVVAEVLERLHIPYLVTGAIATVFFGEPRFTNDIDVVVLMNSDKVEALVGEFPVADFYLDTEAAREAIDRCGQFNLIHPRSGLKVDFMVASATPFNESRFERALRVSPGPGSEAMFATPEDVILMKLVYLREGGSDKHVRDIAGIRAVSGEELDEKYLEEWIEKLGLADAWERIQLDSA